MSPVPGKRSSPGTGMVRVLKLRGRRLHALQILCEENVPLTAGQVGQLAYEQGFYSPTVTFTDPQHMWLEWGQFTCSELVRLGCAVRQRTDTKYAYAPTLYGRRMLKLNLQARPPTWTTLAP